MVQVELKNEIFFLLIDSFFISQESPIRINSILITTATHEHSHGDVKIRFYMTWDSIQMRLDQEFLHHIVRIWM